MTPIMQTWRDQGKFRSYRRPAASSAPSWKQRKKFSKRSCFFIILLLGFFLLSATGIFLLASFAWVSKDLPDPNKIIERRVAQSTKIFDRTGQNVLYEIHGAQQRTMIELDAISEVAKQATIAVEDKDFYQHRGFSLRGIIRATLINLLRGGKLQGGSTITQQLLKNALLGTEKTFSRKFKELLLAYQIEKNFSKDQILKMYFNEIPYGATAYGIEAASQMYFSKKAKDLDLAESALLVAMTKAPTYYSPYGSHTDELINRQHYVIETMRQQNYITDDQAAEAKAINILKRVAPRREPILAPHFVMFVKELLTAKYGERLVEQGGLQVTTTLDLEKQKNAEEIIKEEIEKKTKIFNVKNASLVALDAKTNQILVMVGAKDYFDLENDGNVNVALRPRQPGSSFKPIVYSAAFRKGLTPETTLWDVVTTFKTETKDYTPHNYDEKEYGPVTIRQALAGSLNIPAVKTIYLTGVSEVLDLAEEFGYTTLKERSRFGLAIVLGGAEVKLLEHATAYSVFANEGIYRPSSAILKVTDSNGRILEEWQSSPGKQIIDAQISRQITNILNDDESRAFIFGRNSVLTLPDRTVAAKTGTTNDFHDNWTLGYTPSLVTGVWAGNNDNTEMKTGATGLSVAAPIWNRFMKKALENAAVETFTLPDPLPDTKPILRGAGMGAVKVKIDKASGKLATQETPDNFVVEKTFYDGHSILHYLNPNDILGPAPADPAQDSNYTNWEEAVQRWVQEKGFAASAPPTEYDDSHTTANQPSISVLSPASQSTVTSRILEIQVSASAPRDINRVSYFLDNQYLGTSAKAPYSFTAILSNTLPNGMHALTARAFDDIDNQKTAEINFNLNAEPLPPNVFWLDPSPDRVFSKTDFPLKLTVQITAPDEIQTVTFFAEINNYPLQLGTVTEPRNPQVTVIWPNIPPIGQYRIKAKVFPKSGNASEIIGPAVVITAD